MAAIYHEARPEFIEGTNGEGVLVIHGFTGSTHSMRDYAYGLHQLGYSVSMPCLTGHGTTPDDMALATDQDWIQDVRKAYEDLQSKVNKVYVCGLSMGGTLSLYIAQNFATPAIALVNAASMNLPDFEVLFLNPETPDFIPGIGSDIKKPGVVEWAYPLTPKAAIGSLIRLVKHVDANLHKVQAPTLVFTALEDHVVPPIHSENILNKISSVQKQQVFLKESYHVATLDNDLPIIIAQTHAFFQKHK